MEKYRPLVFKSDEPHGYFWSIWADWGMVAKTGFAFIAVVCAFTLLSQCSEGDNQRNSFQIALTSLAKVELAKPVTQRQSKLLKKNNLYSWRAVLWIAEGKEVKPWIWQAQVLKEGKTFRMVSAQLEPYERDKAESLELLDRVQRPD